MGKSGLVNYLKYLIVLYIYIFYETNCTKAKRRKKERYRHLRSELITACYAFEVITLEVTTLGFVSKDIDRFRRLLRTLEMNDERIIKKCMEVALRATFYIYCRRNKPWNNPDLLNFY